MSYLQKFPFDKIKIDRAFVAGLRRGGPNRAIVRAVVGLSQSFGMLTCAEGVETAEELETLRDEGCGQAQGYMFGHPATAAVIDALLRDKAAAAQAAAAGTAPAGAVRALLPPPPARTTAVPPAVAKPRPNGEWIPPDIRLGLTPTPAT